MAIDLNTEDARLIRGFIPINTLPGFQFDELCDSHQVSTAEDGEQLFAEGSVDTDYYFLLEGSVSLEAGKTQVDIVKTGSANARFALAHHIPRKVTCISQGPVRYLKVDSEMFSEESVSQMLQENDMVSEESELVNEEAIPFLLRAPLFRHLSVSVLPGVSACLEKVTFEADQTIIEQDELNDTFFIIQEGRCKVTHRPFENAKEIQLEDLQQGDTFGEYALLIDDIADVTVKTITDCVFYKIEEKYFNQSIKQPLMREVSWNNADQSGDVFLDIQSLEDYRKTHIKGSVNYPFSTLRVRMGQLADTDKYIVISNDQMNSMAAVFMLRQQGLNAKILSGGLSSVPDGSLDHILMSDADSDLGGMDSESDAVVLETERISVLNPVVIGSPIRSIDESKSDQSAETQSVDQEGFQSELVNAAKEIDSVYNSAIVNDGNETTLIEEDSYDVGLHVKKLEGKLQDVWKAYKKSRSQLSKAKRKYSTCYRELSRLEQNYHSLLVQPEASGDTVPGINPAITTDEINERLREEFAQQVETNKKLKLQNSLLKQKLGGLKSASGSQGSAINRQDDLNAKEEPLTENEALLLQVQELESSVQRLEEKKVSQQNKAKQYVTENNKLRQLIQELAKQAIDEQAQDHILSSFDFSTEFASSDNAYDADSALASLKLHKAPNNSAMDEASESGIKSNVDEKDVLAESGDSGSSGRLKRIFGLKGDQKIRTGTWIGIVSSILLTALVMFLFANTKEGQLLLQQLGF